jgi:hypothetical protein
MTPTPIPHTVIVEQINASLAFYIGLAVAIVMAISAFITARGAYKKSGGEGALAGATAAKMELDEQTTRVNRLRDDVKYSEQRNGELEIKLTAAITRLEADEVESRATITALSVAQAKAVINLARIVKLEADITRVQLDLTEANKASGARIAGLETENTSLRKELTELVKKYEDAMKTWADERIRMQDKIDGLIKTVDELKKGASN